MRCDPVYMLENQITHLAEQYHRTMSPLDIGREGIHRTSSTYIANWAGGVINTL